MPKHHSARTTLTLQSAAIIGIPSGLLTTVSHTRLVTPCKRNEAVMNAAFDGRGCCPGPCASLCCPVRDPSRGAHLQKHGAHHLALQNAHIHQFSIPISQLWLCHKTFCTRAVCCRTHDHVPRQTVGSSPAAEHCTCSSTHLQRTFTATCTNRKRQQPS